MSKKYRNLIEKIVSDENMRRAYRLTSKAKKDTSGYLYFKEWSEINLDILKHSIVDQTYKPSPTRTFTVFEPKPRNITAAAFTDRVVHHALCGVISPIFEATFLPRTFACRDGLGTHAGVKLLQADMRRLGYPSYALKTDFAKYFASIDLQILNKIIRKKISCEATLWLIETITPPNGVGIPIGALTSQLYANIYGSEIDRRLQCYHGVKYWYRYMDDIVVLGKDSVQLNEIRLDIESYAKLNLKLNFSKWSIQPISRGVNFLGYRIWPTHKLLRKRSVIRAKRSIEHFIRLNNIDGLRKFIAAWRGHAEWADSINLCKSLGLKIT
jgi:hypothetical protein